MAETRKLAAILAADVAGYSKLAGSDEERTTCEAARAPQRSDRSHIALHHGRVVNVVGCSPRRPLIAVRARSVGGALCN
jgi:adenylate cyclase